MLVRMGVPSRRPYHAGVPVPFLPRRAFARPLEPVGFLVLVSLALGSRAAQDEPVFRQRAARWSERNRIEVQDSEGIDALLARGFARVDLGPFELRVPPALLCDPPGRATLSELALDLLDLQGEWMEWSATDSGYAPRAKSSKKLLGAWIRSLRDAALAPDALPGRDLFDVLATEASVRDASPALRLAAELALAQEDLPVMRLLFLPTREEFVEFAAVVGFADPRLRPPFWVDGAVQWTDFTFDGTLAVALEYASPRADEDYRLAIPMTAKNPKGLREHVVQLAARSWLEAVYGERMEPLFASALANELVIALFDEVDTRTDGDLRSRSTPSRSVFVPGGKPRGGRLAANLANSRWRALKGRDHFMGVLVAAQEEGAGNFYERWERISGFALRDDKGDSTTLVRAPFLGENATPPPEDSFQGDYLEFLRAYRGAFLHWMREKAAPGTGESHRRFAALLRDLAGGDGDLLEAVRRVYGKSLSAPEARTLDTSLEGAFLLWLSHR